MKKNYRKKLTIACFFLFVILLCPGSAFSWEIISLTNEVKRISINSKVMFLEDVTGHLSLESVKNDKADAGWKIKQGGKLNFGFTDSVYWFKAKIKNDSEKNNKYYFEIGYPLLDHIEVYIVSAESEPRKIIMGDNYPFKKRPEQHRTFVFPMKLRTFETVEIYMRVKTTSAIQLPLFIHENLNFIEESQRQLIILSTFYGAIVILVIYNLLIYLVIREKKILYYSFYIASIVMFAASIDGVCFQFFWPENIWFNSRVHILSIGAVSFFGILFTTNFLNLSEYKPGMNKIFICCLVIDSFFILLCLLDFSYRYCVFFLAVIFIFVTTLSLFIGIARLYRGYLSARYYVLAVITVFISGIILVLDKILTMEINIFLNYSIHSALVLEALLLSFALTDRINIDRKERDKARKFAHEQEKMTRVSKEKLLEEQKRATETMELKVVERTSELDLTVKKVEQANIHIKSSLRYARMIQLSMLPDTEKFEKWLRDYFIIWIPKGIVGGEFYYIDRVVEKHILVVADGTKYGVPGAFLTMLANSELKRIVIGEKCFNPGEIVNTLHVRLREALRQDSDNSFSDERFDLSVCVIDSIKKELCFAAANQDLYYTKNGKTAVLKGDKKSIGTINTNDESGFTEHSITLEAGMNFYVPTDGMINQFTGNKSGQSEISGFEELILKIQDLELDKQQIAIMQELGSERNCENVVDDVTLLAFSSDICTLNI